MEFDGCGRGSQCADYAKVTFGICRTLPSDRISSPYSALKWNLGMLAFSHALLQVWAGIVLLVGLSAPRVVDVRP